MALSPQQLLDKIDPVFFGRSLVATAIGLARHPWSAFGAYQHFAVNALGAAQAVAGRALGQKIAGPVAPNPKDRRFADPAWEENALFFALQQSHLLREQLASELVEAAGLDRPTSQKARFVMQLLIDSLAPTNYLFTNPAAMRRAFETGGTSLLRGIRNFAEDLRQRRGWPRQVDSSGFEVGKSLAVTPGKVVYRNDLFELIQYLPQTPTTFQVPLLCSPPWINKYYIMDLAPGRSFIEWAIQKGHATFAISYKNPDASMRDVSFDDYLIRGLYEATRVVRELTGEAKINIAGLCLGGTLATMLMAYLAELGQDWVGCVTLLNTLVDFSEPGPIGAFVDPRTVEVLARKVERRGYVGSDQMANTFSLLRANDLVFNYIVKNWLMGEEPPAFDLLAWNADSTRLPAKMYNSYLRSCYLDNQLARGEIVVGGKQLRLSRAKQDAFILAAVEDHIAPWRSSFKTTQLWGGRVHFVLTSSGHIAGIVNPPSKNAAYWTNDKLVADPDAWQAAAKKHSETWWEEWARWIAHRAGARKAPPAIGSRQYPPLGDAPGTYVLLK